MLDNGYISINTVIARIRQNPYIKEDFNRITAINLIAQAIRLLNIKDIMEHAVELVNIQDYKGDIPEGLKRIVQTAFRLGKDFVMDKVCTNNCCEYNLNTVNEYSNYSVDITNHTCKEDCNKIIIEKKFYERKSYLPVMNVLDNYSAGINFKPIYPSVNNFGLYAFDKSLNRDYDSNKYYEHSYIIDEYGFQTSFKDGQLLLSFLRTPVDDEGLPLIVNDETVIQVCEKYYYYKTTYWKLLSGIEQNVGNIYTKLEQEFYDALSMAKAKAKMPNKEQLQLGHKYLNTLIPNENKFNSYFGYF